MTEMDEDQLLQTTQTFNTRIQGTELPETAEAWVRLIFENTELAFLLTYGGGYIFKLIAEAEVVEGKGQTSEILEVYLKPPQGHKDRPTSLVNDTNQRVTLIYDSTRMQTVAKIRDFLVAEFAKKHTSLSVVMLKKLAEGPSSVESSSEQPL